VTTTDSLYRDIATELRSINTKPRELLSALVINGFISFLFFLSSYYLGTYNSNILPVAAATILLWTLADLSLTNQLIFDRASAQAELKKNHTLKRLLLVKNLAIVVLVIPITLIFGLILMVVIGRRSDLLYSLLMVLALVWGWLGISNALSALLPFEILSMKRFLGDRHEWIRYSVLYGLPWLLLPVYAIVVLLPFLLLGWTSTQDARAHQLISLAMMLGISLLFWWGGLMIADKYTAKPDARVKKLLV